MAGKGGKKEGKEGRRGREAEITCKLSLWLDPPEFFTFFFPVVEKMWDESRKRLQEKKKKRIKTYRKF